MIKRLAMVLLYAGLCASFLGACTAAKPYRTTVGGVTSPDTPSPPDPTIERTADCEKIQSCVGVGFVEYDEFGRLFNAKQQEEVLRVAKDVLANGGMVLVYIHGWHHNARSANTRGFAQVVARATLIDAKYAKWGRDYPQRQVFGVYIAWPGESIDSNSWPLSWISNLTFWERKNVAHAVGEGGIAELLSTLAEYRYRNDRQKDARLVLMGHSMGAAVLYSSLSTLLLSHMTVTETKNPSAFGDMIVLVNPAFEAMRFTKLWDRTQRSIDVRPLSRQAPLLAILTSMKDGATKHAFKAGRLVSTLFDSYVNTESQQLNTTAVGHYAPYITHSLTVSNDAPFCSTWTGNMDNPRFKSLLSEYRHLLGSDARNIERGNGRACFDDEFANVGPFSSGNETPAKPTVLVRCDARTDCSDVIADLPRANEGETSHSLMVGKRMPFMNIRTSGEVMNGHNDIWNTTLQAFLTQYVTLSLHIAHSPE